jgi:UDP-glucose 4-epimerase
MAGLIIAVTGTTTFFGRGLLVALEADERVARIVALDSRPPPTMGPKTTWQKIDLIHPRSGEHLAALFRAESVDVVVHTAFLARPVHRGGWAHELEAIGTRHVLAAMESTGVRKLVLRSTTLVYGADASHPNYLSESAPLKPDRGSSFIADKIEVEAQTARFAQKHPDRIVTLLRFAPLLGPNADTLATLFFSQPICPTLLGFDPLVQLLHETDAIGATVAAAVHRDVRGAVNVAAPGVLPLSAAIVLARKRSVPLPRFVLRGLSEAMWTLQVGHFPPGLLDFLQYLCIGDLRRMQDALAFQPRFDVRDAIRSFSASDRLLQLAA